MGKSAVFALGALLVAAASAAAEPASAGGAEVLNEGAHWRAFYVWRAPVVTQAAARAEVDDPGTADPPGDWRAPDFSDAAWSRVSLPGASSSSACRTRCIGR